jgi:hypothetical protein
MLLRNAGGAHSGGVSGRKAHVSSFLLGGKWAGIASAMPRLHAANEGCLPLRGINPSPPSEMAGAIVSVNRP